MFKALKDTKRRMVESVMEGVGASEKTVDEEFNLYHAKYQAMMQDLNECGAGFHSILNQQKQFFADGVEFSSSVARIHDQYNDVAFWPGQECQLTCIPAALDYKEKMGNIHNVYRSSCALIAVDNALEPLRDAIAKITPEIDSMVKERNTQLIDYDSYRRRVKALKEKHESYEKNGKAGTPAATENLQEIQKFEGKEKAAKEGYETKNERTKAEILKARTEHDHLMDDVLITSVVCQAELFAAAARELEFVIAMLPPDKVEEVRAKIQDVIKQGGAQVPQKPEKSGIQKGLAIFSGKAVPSDFKKDETPTATATATATAKPVVATAAAAPAPIAYANTSSSSGGMTKGLSFNSGSKSKPASATAKDASNPFAESGNPFTMDEDLSPPPPASGAPPAVKVNPPPPPAGGPPPPPAAPAPPAPPAAAASNTVMVEALYDHEAEADDELNFRTGEMIEVVETSDDGWWKGKCRGNVGLFPVNYVKQLN